MEYNDSVAQKYFTYAGNVSIQTALITIVMPLFKNVDFFPLFVIFLMCSSISIGMFYYWLSNYLEKKENVRKILILNIIDSAIMGLLISKFIIIQARNENVDLGFFIIIAICLVFPVIVRSFIEFKISIYSYNTLIKTLEIDRHNPYEVYAELCEKLHMLKNTMLYVNCAIVICPLIQLIYFVIMHEKVL